MTEIEEDEDSEGWIYLPPDEVIKLQEQKTRLMRRMLDSQMTLAEMDLLPRVSDNG